METEKNRENEQSPEEILRIITEAIEKGGGVILTQQKADGAFITNFAEPVSVEGDFITIEADGWGFDIELHKIIKAELAEPETEQENEK